MKSFSIFISTLFTMFVCHAQVPLTQIEGRLEIFLPSDLSSIIIGKNAGLAPFDYAINNTIVGSNAGRYITGGGSNSFFGSSAGIDNTTGEWNSFFGYGAGLMNVIGSTNSYYGMYAGSNSITGNSNTYLGSWSGLNNAHGDGNIFIGAYCGSSVHHGNNNILIGRVNTDWVVSSDTIHDRLKISDLIYGELDNEILRVYGRLDTENGTVFMRNLGNFDSNKGIKWGESGNDPVLGIIYDGAGTQGENRLHVREFIEDFGTGNEDLMTIKADGKVGIGVDNPDATLHIKDFAKLEPLNTAPDCNEMSHAGRVYYDGSIDKLRVCVSNTGWVNLH